MTSRQEIVRLTREMRARGLVAATCGNISVRHRDRMIITPTRVDYTRLRWHHLVSVDLSADTAPADASLEWPLHLAVYRSRPDVRAIVHTHSPHATARSFDPAPVRVLTEEATYLGMSRIEVAPRARSGSGLLGSAVTTALGARPAVLLARHGVVGVGASPRQALEICAAVEHQVLIERERRQSQSTQPLEIADVARTA